MAFESEMTFEESTASTAKLRTEMAAHANECGPEDKPQWITTPLPAILGNADVLIRGPKEFARFFNGTAFYQALLNANQRQYMEAREDPARQERLVTQIIQSVWVREGRFLIFDEDTGYILIAPIKQTFKLIRHDLVQKANRKRQQVTKLKKRSR